MARNILRRKNECKECADLEIEGIKIDAVVVDEQTNDVQITTTIRDRVFTIALAPGHPFVPPLIHCTSLALECMDDFGRVTVYDDPCNWSAAVTLRVILVTLLSMV